MESRRVTDSGIGYREFRPRVIPVLLMRDRQLYKSTRFADHRYVGDPRNAVRIFNGKAVDELVLLDIGATARGAVEFDVLKEIAADAFMPLGYGGGIRTPDQARQILDIGFEKIILGTAAAEDPDLVTVIADLTGSSSTTVCIDVKRKLFRGARVTYRNADKTLSLRPAQFAKALEAAGAGELIVQSVDRDGTMTGYDIELIAEIADAVRIPVIALGGASSVADLCAAVAAGKAHAAAAGSMFVFQGPHRAVLISYPEDDVLIKSFGGGTEAFPAS